MRPLQKSFQVTMCKPFAIILLGFISLLYSILFLIAYMCICDSIVLIVPHHSILKLISLQLNSIPPLSLSVLRSTLTATVITNAVTYRAGMKAKRGERLNFDERVHLSVTRPRVSPSQTTGNLLDAAEQTSARTCPDSKERH